MENASRRMSLAGAGYLVLVFVGLGLEGGLDAGANLRDVGRFVEDLSPTAFGAGSYAGVLAHLLLVVFAAALYGRIRPADGGSPLPLVALAGGIASATLHIVGYAATGPVAIRGTDLSIAQHATLLDLAQMLHWSGQLSLVLLFAPAAVAALHERALPRWLGWWAAFVSAGLILSVPALMTGIAHIPATLGAVWIAIAGVVLSRERAHSDRSLRRK